MYLFSSLLLGPFAFLPLVRTQNPIPPPFLSIFVILPPANSKRSGGIIATKLLRLYPSRGKHCLHFEIAGINSQSWQMGVKSQLEYRPRKNTIVLYYFGAASVCMCSAQRDLKGREACTVSTHPQNQWCHCFHCLRYSNPLPPPVYSQAKLSMHREIHRHTCYGILIGIFFNNINGCPGSNEFDDCWWRIRKNLLFEHLGGKRILVQRESMTCSHS